MPFFNMDGNGTGSGSGLVVLSGSGAPSDTLGVAGQAYIDTTNEVFYGPKGSTGWGDGIPFAGTVGNHTHNIADVTNLTLELAGKANAVHFHNIADVTNLQVELDGLTDQITQLSGNSSADGHTHVKQNITDLATTDLDLGGNRCLFGNMFATTADFPDAATYHGGFAHSHADGAAYFAHNGAWVELAKSSDIGTGGGGNSSVSNLADLADVTLTDPEAGSLLAYSGAEWQATSTAAVAPKDLSTLLSADGKQVFSWSRQDFYTGGYVVEILPVGVTQNLSSSQPFATAADGSIAMNIAMDTTTLGDFRVFASPTLSPTAYEEVDADLGILGGTYFLAEGLYLSNNFTAPGTYPIYAEFVDVAGEAIGTSATQNVTVSQHGHPVAPRYTGASFSGSSLDVSVAVDTRPHALGFYTLGQVTLYAEASSDAAGTNGWTKSTGVLASEVGDVGEITIANVPAGFQFVRTVAENPSGIGSYSEVYEVL